MPPRRPRRFVAALLVLGAALAVVGVAIARQVRAVRAADRCADLLLGGRLFADFGHEPVVEELDAMGATPAAWRRLADRLEGRRGYLCVPERRVVIVLLPGTLFAARRLPDGRVAVDVGSSSSSPDEVTPDLRLDGDVLIVTDAEGERTERHLDTLGD